MTMTTVSQVKIADIDGELNRLLQESKEVGKIRACLFTMVVYTQKKRRIKFFKEILSAVIQKFPCRIIFIQHDVKADDDYLYVSVASENYDEGETSFACDQITIQVAGKHIERVPFLVSPHFVPDLPIYLLWGQDPTVENQVLPSFEPYASRLIFDTECTKDLRQFSNTMLTKMKELDYDIRDMHWGMTGPWRDVITQVFNSPDRILDLNSSQKIVIEYNHLHTGYFHHSEMQAIYLQAWLSVQLGWKVDQLSKDGDDISFLYEHEKGHCQIILQRKESKELQSGAILSVSVKCQEATTFVLKREETLRKVVVYITNWNVCQLPFTLPLPNLKHGFNFMKEIFYERTSKHYRNMLQQLASANWNSIYVENG